MNTIDLDKISLSEQTQCRAELNQEALDEYCERFKAGETPPPISLIFDSAKYYITDGHHRYHAARQAGIKSLPCVITEGTLRDATLLALQANNEHGVRRTNADKRKAVMMLLGDAEWGAWSNCEIARQCLVGEATVRRCRETLSSPMTMIDTPRRARRGSQVYEQKPRAKSSKSVHPFERLPPESKLVMTEAERNKIVNQIFKDASSAMNRMALFKAHLMPAEHTDLCTIVRTIIQDADKCAKRYTGA